MTDAEAKEMFWLAVRDPDPSSMEVAQDIALEHGWKLWKLGEEIGASVTTSRKAPHDSVGGFWFKTADLECGADWNISHRRPSRGNYWIEMNFEYEGVWWTWESSGFYPTLDDARNYAVRYAWHALRVMKSAYSDGVDVDRVRGLIDAKQPDQIIAELNPSMTKNPDDISAARDKYKEFHRYDAKRVGEFPTSFKLPKKMRLAGKAKWVTYRSGKVDPATLQKPRKPIDYIHEHDAGVQTFIKDDEPDTDVPEQFRDVEALVKLGDCLGFCVVDADGEEVEAEGRSPLPELYATPDGKCLFVIQGKRDVLAATWGGGLGVYARGIDG